MAKKPSKTPTKKKKSKSAEKFSIQNIIDKIEQRIPPQSAESWDVVGVLCGDVQKKFSGAVVGVDLTRDLLNFAIQSRANLILNHHPAIFPKGKGLSRLVRGKEEDLTTLLMDAVAAGIVVYVAHTNFDLCATDGMLDLADQLGIQPIGRLHSFSDESALKKLITYVPLKDFENVRDAVFAAGAGQIGNYDCCGFQVKGEGSFRGLAGSDPVIGQSGQLEKVNEVRFETVFPAGLQPIVVGALKNAHPYEEVAYDIFDLNINPSTQGIVSGLGYGIYGDFPKAISREEFIQIVKDVFQVDLFLTNNLEKKVKRVAFSPGKGSSFVGSARSVGADVLITGEVGYHGSLDALRKGMMVFELGHRESEHFFLRTFYAWFHEWGLKVFPLDQRTQHVV